MKRFALGLTALLIASPGLAQSRIGIAAPSSDGTAVMSAPMRKASGAPSSAIRTRLVRVSGSAWGAISRSLPSIVRLGSICRTTRKACWGFNLDVSDAGTSTTASRASVRASVITLSPAETTSPTSAERAVTTPSKGAVRTAKVRAFSALSNCASALFNSASATLRLWRATSRSD